MKDSFLTLYRPSLSMLIGDDTISISNSDIVSLSFIHNYDTATYPIIRLRLYTDLENIQKLCSKPDEIYVRGLLAGGIYRMNDNSNPVLVQTRPQIQISLKAYIENKNIPTSEFDQYEDGKKKTSNMNDNIKSPIELYCYDDKMIHYMKKKVRAIYKNTTVGTVIENILLEAGISSYYIDPIYNSERFNQILIPNLNALQAMSFFDEKYGIYPKGGMIYGDIDKLYICNTDILSHPGTRHSIYIQSYKDNSDMTGMMLERYDEKGKPIYVLSVMAPNISITTESDIERVLHGPKLAAINLNDPSDIEIEQLSELFKDAKLEDIMTDISVPNLLHKTKNKYIAKSFIARLDEHITHVDISGTGFPLDIASPISRFGLTFANPLRGKHMDYLYRPTYICQTLSNMDADMFIAQTTMNLCRN